MISDIKLAKNKNSSLEITRFIVGKIDTEWTYMLFISEKKKFYILFLSSVYIDCVVYIFSFRISLK